MIIRVEIMTRAINAYKDEMSRAASNSLKPIRTRRELGMTILRPERYKPSPYPGNSVAGFEFAIQPAKVAYVPSSGARNEGVEGKVKKVIIRRIKDKNTIA